MIDFTPLRNKQKTMTEFSRQFSPTDLRTATEDLYDYLLNLLEDCQDADIVFVPEDPKANDPYAQDPTEIHMPWTLGHVIVHLNASLEESTFLAAEMARGVENHGRSRYEVPWRSITTAAQCRDLLKESRRMCLASLEIWPAAPHYEVTYAPWQGADFIDARGRYLSGLKHADDHLGQIREIIRQVKL
jgi:hypothetical protein